MRMIGRILVFVLAAAGLAACRKPQPADGPGMVYNFAEYELAGDWTELNGEGKITFAGEEMTRDGVTQSFSVSQEDRNTRATVTAGGKEYLFRRIEADGWPVNVLFECGESGEVLHTWIKDTYLGYVPEGWMPAPDDDRQAAVNEEKAAANFRRHIIIGEWQEAGAQEPWLITFTENGMVWRKADGTETEGAYTVSAAGDVHTDADGAPYRDLRCRMQIINGESVYVLFAVTETGGPVQTGCFLRTDGLSAVPEGYVPVYDEDVVLAHDGPVYVSEDVMEMMEWLGKRPADTGVPEELIEERRILFEGELFGKKVMGTARYVSEIYRAAVYSEELGYDTAVSRFTELYGEGSPLEIPYSAVTGHTDAVMFFPEKYKSVTVIRYSGTDWTEISFDYMVNTQ